MIATLLHLYSIGLSRIPHAWTLIKVALLGAFIYVLKKWFGGAANRSERNMHGKVVIMTVCSQIEDVVHSDNETDQHDTIGWNIRNWS